MIQEKGSGVEGGRESARRGEQAGSRSSGPSRSPDAGTVARRWALLAAVLLVPACGSGGSGSGFGPAGAVLTPPVAIVPENFKALVSAANVKLDGSKSYDPVPGAPPLAFLWTQTSGTAVALSSATAAAPTFTAPAARGSLTFLLTVTGAQGTDSASVTVSVQTFIVSAPDQWFAGYGNSATITATVAGATITPVYQWTGIPPWVTVSGGSLTSLSFTFTTPLLTDLQNFEDVPDVAVLERTTQGRAQFTITVTDGLTVDQSFVNFSAGPFSNTMANQNVAFGNPAFLNGAATTNGTVPVTGWTWAGTAPSGAAVAFFKPNKAALGGDTS